MRFYKINEGGAGRDDGIVVQIKHADYLEYREGELAVDLSIGYDRLTRQIYVYASDATHWSRPDPSVVITATKKFEIIKNLEEALALLKGNYVVN